MNKKTIISLLTFALLVAASMAIYAAGEPANTNDPEVTMLCCENIDIVAAVSPIDPMTEESRGIDVEAYSSVRMPSSSINGGNGVRRCPCQWCFGGDSCAALLAWRGCPC